MKAKNGKCGVFAALTAALLVTAALITSCPAPEEVIVYRDGYQPPAGMGYIRINLPQFTGRTALPVAGDWTSFDLSIKQYATETATSPTLTIPTKNVSATELGDPINLAPGFYEVTVTAKIGSGQEAAEGTSSRELISAGVGTHISVIIKPLPYSENDDGTLEYTVIFSGVTGATAQMTITDLVDGGPTTFNTATTVPAGTYTVSLKPGSYSVFLEATTVGGKTASITEIANIHQNLTSKVTFDFNGDFFVAFIDINFTYETADDVKPELAQGVALTEVPEGDIIILSLDTQNGGATKGTATITITNEDEFDSITWYCGGSAPKTVSGDYFVITAGTAPFIDPIKYPVTVVGTINGVGAYSTSFVVQIND